MAIFPPRFILAPCLSEATCLPLLTRMFLADVFPFRCSKLQQQQPFLLTELKGNYVCSMVSQRNPDPDLRPRDEVLEAACVDALKC